jgi:hypothetical protein
MGFVNKREKTGGRQLGTRNKVNLFEQSTIDQAKEVIAEKVAQGDIECSKLVLQYSLSKPASHLVGVAAENEEVKNAVLVEDTIRKYNNPDLANY